MKRFKRILLAFIGTLAVISFSLWLMGYGYLFTGIRHTYLIGKTTPDITDIDVFPTRKLNAPEKKIRWAYHQNFTETLSKKEVAFLKSLETASFLVIKNDSVLYENYWGKFNKHTPTNSFSMAKSIVALLVGIALDEGKIKSLDEPITNYLPEFSNTSITIRHLLWMSSGLDWDESGTNPFSDNARAYYGTNLNELVLAQKPKEMPGQTFDYMSSNTQLLALILEKATGKALSKYAEEKIWTKVGAERNAYWSLAEENTTEKAYCCFYATTRDFAKIGRLIQQKGWFNGKQIIPENYIEECLKPNPTLEKDGRTNHRYGMHFWLGNYQGEGFYHLQGLYGQYVIILPESNIIIVRTGRKRLPYDKSKLPADLYRYIEIAKNL